MSKGKPDICTSMNTSTYYVLGGVVAKCRVLTEKVVITDFG